MAKFIVYCSGKPLIYGYKRGPFKWSETYKCFIFEGTILGEDEFNARVEHVLKNYGDYTPVVKIVEFSNAANPASTPQPAPIQEPAPTTENMEFSPDPITSRRRPKAAHQT